MAKAGNILANEDTVLRDRLERIDFNHLRQSIKFLVFRYPEAYENTEDLLKELDRFQRKANRLSRMLERTGSRGRQGMSRQLDRMETFRRDTLLSHPALRDPILYVRRPQYVPDHHNTATMFVTGEINTGSFRGGGSLRTVDLHDGCKVQVLVDAGPEGSLRDPNVHFDGIRILFSMRKDIHDDYHIYEVGSNGEELVQLTRARGVADIDPVYLPDDTIVFTSTREHKYCMCNRHIMGNLFRMENDGANIHQIGKSTLHEGHGCVLPDGRILYDRWEYVDRNFGDAQGLWTVYPDGTGHAVYWGNNTWSPGGVLDSRPVPSTQSVLCVFGSCHDRPWGALALLDRRLALDGRRAVLQTWPKDAVERMGREDEPKQGYGFDRFIEVFPKYEDPWPLDEMFFLCSRQKGRGEEMAIFLGDRFGNEILLHEDAPGCFDPMPLTIRSRPRELPTRMKMDEDMGHFYVVNVYEGTHMDGVQMGSVRFLRVVESPEKRFWTHPSWNGQGVHCPAMNWHSFENKRILGTVPVEPDGSASFLVPSDRFVYFQLLDEEGMMVQSMRSGTMVRPGEVQGCMGCHESRLSAPSQAMYRKASALIRPPSELKGWYGPPRIFSYMQEVQPVFDRNCLSCHDFDGKASKSLILAGDRTLSFNASYIDLWSRGYTGAIGAGPHEIQQARSWGSHVSRLVSTLRKGHQDIQLSQEERDRIVTWIDINAVYYPSYASAYPDHAFGRSPLTPSEEARFKEITGVQFVADHAHRQRAQVSFERPEMSPCLRHLRETSPQDYEEAVAMLRQGWERLQKTPRADMPGFVPCVVDQRREERYLTGRKREAMARQAIRESRRYYDPVDGIDQ